MTPAEGRPPDTIRSGEDVMRPYIELARELVSRLGLTTPAQTTSRRSVK
jgi:hypothetical protein